MLEDWTEGWKALFYQQTEVVLKRFSSDVKHRTAYAKIAPD